MKQLLPIWENKQWVGSCNGNMSCLSYNSFLFLFLLFRKLKACESWLEIRRMAQMPSAPLRRYRRLNCCACCNGSKFYLFELQTTPGEGPSSDSGVESTGDGSRTGTPTSFANNYTGILTLVNQQRVC
jgi:hypothetical protein